MGPSRVSWLFTRYQGLKGPLQESLAMLRPTSGTEPQYEELRYGRPGEED